jgi:hypothetical protein
VLRAHAASPCTVSAMTTGASRADTNGSVRRSEQSPWPTLWDDPKAWIVTIVGVIIVAATFFSIVNNPSTPAQLAVPDTVGFSSTSDGELIVGDQQVPQMLSSCAPTGACRPIPPAVLPSATINGTVATPITAGASTQFTFATSSGSSPVPVMTVADGQLTVSPGAPGTWITTVSGDAGGRWMMRLTVTTAPGRD